MFLPAFLLCMPVHAQMQTQTAPQTQEAPAPPASDIYTVSLDTTGKDGWKFGTPHNVTSHKGYDNQPFFTPDGKAILFTSIRDGDQADIYRLDLSAGTTERLTNTPESEFSPTITTDEKHISVVRVEKDQTQRLWRFSLTGQSPEVVLPDIKRVGYHRWLDIQHVVLFILGDPETLQLVHVPTHKMTLLASNPGRCFGFDPQNYRLTYVEKISEQEWWVRELDLQSTSKIDLIRTPPGSEDFVWTSDGTLVMAAGSKVFTWKAGQRDWKEAADFSSSGLQKITRLALSPDGATLALVAFDP